MDFEFFFEKSAKFSKITEILNFHQLSKVSINFIQTGYEIKTKELVDLAQSDCDKWRHYAKTKLMMMMVIVIIVILLMPEMSGFFFKYIL